MPARFGLTYPGDDNAEHTPDVIHRALLGSLERFVGIHIEHSGGDLPLLLAPEQVRVLAISERFAADAESLADDLRVHGFRASVDEREETLGRKIRDAELAKIPYSSSGVSASPSTLSRSGDAVANRQRSGGRLFCPLLRLSRSRTSSSGASASRSTLSPSGAAAESSPRSAGRPF